MGRVEAMLICLAVLWAVWALYQIEAQLRKLNDRLEWMAEKMRHLP